MSHTPGWARRVAGASGTRGWGVLVRPSRKDGASSGRGGGSRSQSRAPQAASGQGRGSQASPGTGDPVPQEVSPGLSSGLEGTFCKMGGVGVEGWGES